MREQPKRSRRDFWYGRWSLGRVGDLDPWSSAAYRYAIHIVDQGDAIGGDDLLEARQPSAAQLRSEALLQHLGNQILRERDVVARDGLRIAMGAFVACLIVGVLVTPIAERLRLPFAGIAFASVVSLIPGIFLFRMGGGLLTLIALGAKAPAGLLQDVIVDGATAFVVVLAMGFGLIIPKLCLDRHRHARCPDRGA
jgi:hypothetical protein